MFSKSNFVSDNHVVIMSLVFATAVFNGCTQGYDQSMMNNLNLYDSYVDCKYLYFSLLFVASHSSGLLICYHRRFLP